MRKEQCASLQRDELLVQQQEAMLMYTEHVDLALQDFDDFLAGKMGEKGLKIALNGIRASAIDILNVKGENCDPNTKAVQEVFKAKAALHPESEAAQTWCHGFLLALEGKDAYSETNKAVFSQVQVPEGYFGSDEHMKLMQQLAEAGKEAEEKREGARSGTNAVHKNEERLKQLLRQHGETGNEAESDETGEAGKAAEKLPKQSETGKEVESDETGEIGKAAEKFLKHEAGEKVEADETGATGKAVENLPEQARTGKLKRGHKGDTRG